MIIIYTNTGDIFDWSFFWQNFGYFAKMGGPFVMIAVAVLVVGMLFIMVILAVAAGKKS